MPTKFFHAAVFLSAEFFNINFFTKNLSGTLSEYQTSRIQVRTDRMLQDCFLFVCLMCFFTSHQQSFSYKGTGLPGFMCLAQIHKMLVLIWVQTVCKVICRGQNLPLARKELRVKVIHMSRDMRFPTMWYFDKCRLRRACAASY